MRILVTGGAGYIGGAFVRSALAVGHEVAVIDNLSTGHRDCVPKAANFVEADIREKAVLASLLAESDAVVHFAALSIVSDSIANPMRYYSENLGGFIALLDAIGKSPTRRLIFSSSAAVYGHGRGELFREDDPLAPVNPYGGTKLAMEKTLAQVAPSLGLSWSALRYFNAAGALSDHGERHDPETHLVPLALESAQSGETIRIFGSDYPTDDGTCVRDYIHIADLAEAHLLALEALSRGSLGPMNLGTGEGHSVREVLDSVERVTGRRLPVEEAERREGDPAILVADPSRAAERLGWRPALPALDDIVESAWRWMQ